LIQMSNVMYPTYLTSSRLWALFGWRAGQRRFFCLGFL